MSKQTRGRPDDVEPQDAWQYFSRYIGQALHLERELKNITQEKIASALSHFFKQPISQNYVNAVEMGDISIAWPCFALWSEILGCKPSAIVQKAESLSEKENTTDTEIIRDALENIS